MTLRELLIEHDAYQIDRWWHTAFITSQLYNLQTIVINALSRKGGKMKPKEPSELHPFVEHKVRGQKVTAATIGILKNLGNAMVGKK